MEVYELFMEGQRVIFKDISMALDDIRAWAEEGDNVYPGPSLRRLYMSESDLEQLKEHEGY